MVVPSDISGSCSVCIKKLMVFCLHELAGWGVWKHCSFSWNVSGIEHCVFSCLVFYRLSMYLNPRVKRGGELPN